MAESEDFDEEEEAVPARVWKLCPVCGETFDSRIQEQVFHHGPEPHKPLAKAS